MQPGAPPRIDLDQRRRPTTLTTRGQASPPSTSLHRHIASLLPHWVGRQLDHPAIAPRSVGKRLAIGGKWFVHAVSYQTIAISPWIVMPRAGPTP